MAEILNILHFPAQTSSAHPMQWSPNNRLAVSCRKGIYVLELGLNPTCTLPQLNIHKSFIPNQTKPSTAPNKFNQDLSDISEDLKNRILQDRVLAPLSQDSKSVNYMRYVGWSPFVDIGSRKEYLLITLSLDYSFRLLEYRPDLMEWICYSDLTSTLLQYIKTHPKLLRTQCLEKGENEREENIIRRAYLAATLTVHWAEQNRFVSGQEGGQLVFWTQVSGKVGVEQIINPEQGSISALVTHQIQGRKLTYFGTVDGRVSVILDLSDKPCQVWKEQDRLKVTHLQIWSQKTEDDIWKLIICKANFVLVLSLSFDNFNTSIQVLEQYSLIAGISSIAGVELIKAPLSAIQHSVICQSSHRPGEALRDDIQPDPKPGTEHLAVMAHRGSLILWDGKKKKLEIKVGVDRRDYGTWGFVSSPNQAIYCVLECISVFNDHLLQREPSRIIFFSLLEPKYIRSKLRCLELKPDFLELYRVILYSKGFDVGKLDELLNKHCRWWVASALVSQKKPFSNMTELAAIEKVLRCNAASSVLFSCAVDRKAKAAAARFLELFSADEDSLSLATELKSELLYTWRCAVCASEARTETLRTVVCLNNHRWGRCGLTQLPCDDPSYRTCSWCSALYLEMGDEPVLSCSLCSGPVGG